MLKESFALDAGDHVQKHVIDLSSSLYRMPMGSLYLTKTTSASTGIERNDDRLKLGGL